MTGAQFFPIGEAAIIFGDRGSEPVQHWGRRHVTHIWSGHELTLAWRYHSP